MPPASDGLVALVATKTLLAAAVVLAAYGLYLLLSNLLVERVTSKRCAHDVRNVARLVLGGVAVAGVLGIVTEQWVGVLLSFGIVGFAITFALQQPMLSFLGWLYIMVKRPYSAGDRVRIGDARGTSSRLTSSSRPSGK